MIKIMCASTLKASRTALEQGRCSVRFLFLPSLRLSPKSTKIKLLTILWIRMDKKDNICVSFHVSHIGSCFRIIIRKENYNPRMLTVIWDIRVVRWPVYVRCQLTRFSRWRQETGFVLGASLLHLTKPIYDYKY